MSNNNDQELIGMKHKVCSFEQAKEIDSLTPELNTAFLYCNYTLEGENKTDLIAAQLEQRWEQMMQHDDVENMEFYPALDIVELMSIINHREISLSRDEDNNYVASYPKMDISTTDSIPAQALASITIEILKHEKAQEEE